MMSAAVALPIAESCPRLFTADELLAMPDDGKDRWLIRGKLRERVKMYHTRAHSQVATRLAYLFGNWIDKQPEPRGEAYCLPVVHLRRDPDTCLEIDLVYLAPTVVAKLTDRSPLIDEAPTFVAKIISLNDVKQKVTELINESLAAGVALVWVIDTDYKTVTVHRPGQAVELFNTTQTLSADPHLPGFTVPVARIFRR